MNHGQPWRSKVFYARLWRLKSILGCWLSLISIIKVMLLSFSVSEILHHNWMYTTKILAPLLFTLEFGVRFPISVVWKLFLSHQRVKLSIAGSLRDREVTCSASDCQDSKFESCVWRIVSSHSSHHPREVIQAQFSLYVHKGSLKPDSFHFYLV